jgi:pilus assembly protein CpaB
MNWKTWIPLVLAIVLGVVAAKVARDVIVRKNTASTQAAKLAKIIVAKADIAPGHELKAEDLGDSPVENVPADSFKDAPFLIGRIAEAKIAKGQPILEPMLAPSGVGAGLQALVPQGMRAVTVEVNEFTGVAGLLLPGCKVDVIATINADGKQVARTIVQNVKVTAIGQRTVVVQKDNNGEQNQPPEVVRAITLLASLKEAESIELAAATGRPRLVLRGSKDTEVAKSEGVSINELRGADREGFWANVFKLMEISQKNQLAMAQAKAATQPSYNGIERRNVKVYRSGVESVVTLEIKKDRSEASTNEPAVPQ